MPSRLQTQPMETKVAAPTALQSVAAPTHQLLTVPPAAHTIEPELLAATPRLVVRDNAPRPVWFNERSYGASREQKLLRSGIPVVATIDSVEFERYDFAVGFVYEPGAGNAVRQTANVSEIMVRHCNLASGSQFTVLVSPDDTADILPYFLAADYRVVPVVPTDVSRAVSARLAEYDAQVAAQPVGTLGAIEPELLTATPRRVRLTRTSYRFVSGIVAFCMAYLTAISAFWSLIVENDFAQSFLIVSAMFFVQFVQNTTWDVAAKSFRMLRGGAATRAIVTGSHVSESTAGSPREKQVLEYAFAFSVNNKVIYGKFWFNRITALAMGIVEGATFTVVYDPNKPMNHEPYFKITNAEIVGAMGAKITPP